MLSVAQIRGDRLLSEIVQTVATDFLQHQIPTPWPELYEKLNGREEVLESLVQHCFLQRFFTNEVVPGLLAFEYGDSERLEKAKGYVEMVLQSLKRLLKESHYSERQFSFDQILASTKGGRPFARPEHVRIALLLIPCLGPSLGSYFEYNWNPAHSTIDRVKVTDMVLKSDSAEDLWNSKIREILKRDSVVKEKPTNLRENIIETAFNQYQLFEQIGAGANGWVRRATDSQGTEFAVKLLDPRLASTTKRKRFRNEIRFSSYFSHPNVISVNDWGIATVDGKSTPFYVMPKLRESLRTLLPALADPELRLRYFDQMLSGVEAAHLLGVVHRDLKPENVLYDADRNALVVADFGIAHFTDDELFTAVETRDGERLANFQYAAPEQRERGITADLRCDIFALGLMLNEMFTGKVPHGEGYATIASVATEYAFLDEVVTGMIQHDPAKRAASVAVVKKQLLLRQLEFVALQRLSEISNRVVPVGDEDDPLALTPPQVIDFDWKNGELTLYLDRQVSGAWGQAMRSLASRGSYQWIGQARPDMVMLLGDRAVLRAQEHEVQVAINHFKKWLPRVTEIYRADREEARRKAAGAERRAMQVEREELERRQRIKAQIKI